MYKHDKVNISNVIDTLDRELEKLKSYLPYYGEVAGSLKDNKISTEQAAIELMYLVAEVDDFVSYWKKYTASFNEAVDKDVDNLEIDNRTLKEEVDKLKGENKALKEEVSRLESLIASQTTDRANQLLDLIEARIGQIAQSEKLKRKEITPALRVDISDKEIIEMFKSGMTAYRIGKACGMTQQAIIYRLKKLGLK